MMMVDDLVLTDSELEMVLKQREKNATKLDLTPRFPALRVTPRFLLLSGERLLR